MTPIIHQTAQFRATPELLIELYLDSRKHSASTGAPAKVNRTVGGKFTAFNGAIHGTTLGVIPGKRIVQLWRAAHWKKEDSSIVILTFTHAANGARDRAGACWGAGIRPQGSRQRLAEILLETVEEIPGVTEKGHAELAAAYELDDFEPITGSNYCRVPFAPRQDLQVEFDGDPAGIQPQLVEQGAHRRTARGFTFFAVHLYLNCISHGWPTKQRLFT